MTILPGGERFPQVMEGWLPDYWITLYLMSARRPKGLAARTLLRDAINLIVFREWAANQGIELEKLLLGGAVLDAHEISAFADRALRASPSAAKVVPIAVSRALYESRLATVEQYVDWVASHASRRLSAQDVSYTEAEAGRKAMARSFCTLRAGTRRRGHIPRAGLPEEALDRLVEVVQPDHPENPWVDLNTRIRNRAMILTQLTLGLRAGELLALKLEDLDLGQGRLRIVRRPDDEDDPRPTQPTAKTRGRSLPLSRVLIEILSEYITTRRFQTPGAKRHPYIWVGHKVGRNLGGPIEYTSLQQIFHRLRQVDGLGSDLRSHALRHSYNDRLSRLFDSAGSSDNREAQIRNYLLGWSPVSQMAGLYSQRHTRVRASDVSMASQARLFSILQTEKA